VRKYNEFSVCLPPPHYDMRAQLNFCATRSGRDFDKFKECGFTALPAQSINSFIIKESGLVYECRVVYKSALDPSGLSKQIYDTNYKSADIHTFYYGEILQEYRMTYDRQATVIVPPGPQY
jgi:flavin reductase (DIM6/NTAB) family NADH-FMN oxidoreductase RutF